MTMICGQTQCVVSTGGRGWSARSVMHASYVNGPFSSDRAVQVCDEEQQMDTANRQAAWVGEEHEIPPR